MLEDAKLKEEILNLKDETLELRQIVDKLWDKHGKHWAEVTILDIVNELINEKKIHVKKTIRRSSRILVQLVHIPK